MIVPSEPNPVNGQRYDLSVNFAQVRRVLFGMLLVRGFKVKWMCNAGTVPLAMNLKRRLNHCRDTWSSKGDGALAIFCKQRCNS